MIEIKKSSASAEDKNQTSDVIISGKTYTVNELAPFFTRNALRFADKRKLYELWQIAVETGVKQFITNVDNAFTAMFPRE